MQFSLEDKLDKLNLDLKDNLLKMESEQCEILEEFLEKHPRLEREITLVFCHKNGATRKLGLPKSSSFIIGVRNTVTSPKLSKKLTASPQETLSLDGRRMTNATKTESKKTLSLQMDPNVAHFWKYKGFYTPKKATEPQKATEFARSGFGFYPERVQNGAGMTLQKLDLEGTELKTEVQNTAIRHINAFHQNQQERSKMNEKLLSLKSTLSPGSHQNRSKTSSNNTNATTKAVRIPHKTMQFSPKTESTNKYKLPKLSIKLTALKPL